MKYQHDFAGMRVLVTGSSQGIGAATAIAFARAGAAEVTIQGRAAMDKAKAVADQVRAAGARCEVLAADLETRDGVRGMLAALGGREYEILVNNAGSLVQRTKFLDFTPDLWDRVFTLNLDSAMAITQAVLPRMVER